MPDRPLTVATYAAGASLAAATLVYVFGPTFFLDSDSSTASRSTRKKGIVGLSNPANDCFINSVLQALAGLGELRTYLIREIHRRDLDGSEIILPEPETDEHGRKIDLKKVEGLLRGQVTRALKQVLDNLNERPIYRKTISANGFVVTLENVFGTRISRQQQDAQEFLQVVAERLCDEYHARRKNKSKPGRASVDEGSIVIVSPPEPEKNELRDSNASEASPKSEPIPGSHASTSDDNERSDGPEEDGFPFEGVVVSQIECQTCHFKTKPNSTTFVTLTLHVPQLNSTTLGSCFDSLLKTEYIEDYKCDRCRLEHALEVREKELLRAADSSTKKADIAGDIDKIRGAIRDDPETPPEGVALPDIKLAPKRRIAKHTHIASFPKIMAIHLSRSIFDPHSVSTKNAAKVNFPERLPLGGILDRRQYKLLGLITHRGSHNSGHYETFRRQNLYPPYSTPTSFKQTGVKATTSSPASSAPSSPNPSAAIATPKPRTSISGADAAELLAPSTASSSPSLDSLSVSSARPSTSSTEPTSRPSVTSAPTPRHLRQQSTAKPPGGDSKRAASGATKEPSRSSSARKKKTTDRWWRISDEKVKECRTSDALGMQKEVYLLFYELDRESQMTGE